MMNLWTGVAVKPENGRVVLLYDYTFRDIGLGWRANDDSWAWSFGNSFIRIGDGENQISHWMYPPNLAAAVWNSIEERLPELEKPLLLHHPRWLAEFSIGCLMPDGRWRFKMAIGLFDLSSFVDEERHIRYWMPLPDQPVN